MNWLTASAVFCDAGSAPFGVERSQADALRIGVVDRVAEVVAAEDDDEAMLAHRFDEHFEPGNCDVLQQLAHGDAAFGRRPAGAAVG